MTRVFCFGGAHQDRTARCQGAFIAGASNPVRVETTLGGAALNTAFNLKRLGGDTALLSVVGDDAVGQEIAKALVALGMSPDGLCHRSGLASANYTAILEESGDLVAGLADMAIYESLQYEELSGALKRLEASPAAGDLVFLDANLPGPVIERLCADLQGQRSIVATAAVSPVKVKRLSNILENINYLFCNRAELAALVAFDVTDDAGLRNAGGDLSRQKGLTLFVTQGAEGVMLCDHGQVQTLPAKSALVVDVNGAGDAFAAATLHALTNGAETANAVAFGQAAAALALEVPGSTRPDLTQELVLSRLAKDILILQ